MSPTKRYFFCGVGGSGMLPLALYLREKGAEASGSDRARDAGDSPEKFAYLEAAGVKLFPEDGSGVVSSDQIVVRSGAVEDDKPDILAAKRLGARDMKRPALLAEIVNAAPTAIAVGGTSGKSTTTAMIGWILDHAGRDPSIINGAAMANYASKDAPFVSHRTGGGDALVAEVDESDGSITFYHPAIGVITNISKDHKTLEELRALFSTFAQQSGQTVLNLDNAETAALAAQVSKRPTTFSLHADRGADFFATAVTPLAAGIRFTAHDRANSAEAMVTLATPGRHNVANALAAIAAASLIGVSLDQAARALETFAGVRRRLEIIGAAQGVTVIDDFAHNPDKIAATLATLREAGGRTLVYWQPHGYGPLDKERSELAQAFINGLGLQDWALFSPPVYKGGTTRVNVTHADLAADIRAGGRNAEAIGASAPHGATHPPLSPTPADRDAAMARLLGLAQRGDRIVIMGARDDTLTTFAHAIVSRLGASLSAQG